MSLPPMVATKDMAPAFFRFMGIPAPGDEPPIPRSLRDFAQAPADVTAVSSYTYQPFGTAIREDYAARDVIAFRGFNIADPTQLLSPLSAGRYDISISRQATMQAASVLANWSIPAGAWVAPKGE